MTELEEKILTGINSARSLMANMDVKLIEESILGISEEAQIDVAKDVDQLIVMLQNYVKQ